MRVFETRVARWRLGKRAAWTLTFDGGYEETWVHTRDLLQRYGVRGTYYLVTGCVGTHLEGFPVAPWAEWRNAREAGMEIGSHTVTHPKLSLPLCERVKRYMNIQRDWIKSSRGSVELLRKLLRRGRIEPSSRGELVNIDFMVEELVRSKEVLDRVLGQNTVSLAYPYGLYTSRLKESVRKIGYLSARSTDGGLNYSMKADLYALRSEIWHTSTTLEEANDWLDQAVEEGCWLIETFHLVGTYKPEGYSFHATPQALESHLDHASKADVWIDTQENIVKYLLLRQIVQVKLVSEETNCLTFVIEKLSDSMPFESPLTLCTCVPLAWQNLEVSPSGKILKITQVSPSEAVVYYDVPSGQHRFSLIRSH